MRTVFLVILLLIAGAGGLQLVKSAQQDASAGAVPAASPAAPASAAVAAPADDDDSALSDDEGDDEDEDEQVVALEDIPAAVLKAAREAVPGLVPDSAEIDESSGEPVYDVHGLVGDEPWEVEVTPAGVVLNSERDD